MINIINNNNNYGNNDKANKKWVKKNERWTKINKRKKIGKENKIMIFFVKIVYIVTTLKIIIFVKYVL